jgi:hypothetical protein
VFLGAKAPDFGPDDDRLTALAEWIGAPDNPFFARAQVNRVWLHLMGRGHPELLEYLVKRFAAGGFRLKPLVREVMTSRTYQRAATSFDRHTMSDDLHHSHAAVLPLKAEQLIDALAQVTGVPVQFRGYPLGLRANQVPAPPQSGRRGSFDGMGERFLKVFGKPDRLLTCECERSDDPGLLQDGHHGPRPGQPRRQDALGRQAGRRDAGGDLPFGIEPQAVGAGVEETPGHPEGSHRPPRRLGRRALGGGE